MDFLCNSLHPRFFRIWVYLAWGWFICWACLMLTQVIHMLWRSVAFKEPSNTLFCKESWTISWTLCVENMSSGNQYFVYFFAQKLKVSCNMWGKSIKMWTFLCKRISFRELFISILKCLLKTVKFYVGMTLFICLLWILFVYYSLEG